MATNGPACAVRSSGIETGPTFAIGHLFHTFAQSAEAAVAKRCWRIRGEAVEKRRYVGGYIMDNLGRCRKAAADGYVRGQGVSSA